MIELLKEARGQLAVMHDHLMELSAKLPMRYFVLVDSGLIQNAGNLIERINAELAQPAPDAMEIVDKVREHRGINGPAKWVLSRPKAAALIESYGKREERATDLLKIIVSSETRKINQDPYPCGHRACKFVRIAQDILAAKHSYKVED